MSSFNEVLEQYEQSKEQITLLDTLTEIAAQLKRIADTCENNNAEIKRIADCAVKSSAFNEVIDSDLPF